ncbi:MAG: App1 family protein [Planctomycetia bacterium]|nr:App1 family protein [Planctomycetia bacterium]
MPHKSQPNIEQDERVIFFPTIGHFDRAAGQWHVPIHGWVYRPEEDSRRRAVVLAMVRGLLGVEPAGAEAALFNERMRAFLVDNRGGKVVNVRVGEKSYALGPSAPNGHVTDALRLPSDVIGASEDAAPGDCWLPYEALLPPGDERACAGAVHLLGASGLSVVSDIDDTIKISHVGERRLLFRQTFLRAFEAVPGMAELYARWGAAGAAFHYVSRSPWQLFAPLADFLAGHGFPGGTFHMRHFRWKEGRTLRPSLRGTAKRLAISAIIDTLPGRRFALVGDSGQRDPEIYGQLARQYPEQVVGIFIRSLAGDPPHGERFQEAFADVPPGRWRVFDEPREVPDGLP